ncbi:hemerythrin domain-containing protein [Roseateles violae]|uniref:Hemerythrin domain-containing protein n=1 Tax=Roseateles violae TaxID=3058042 RepID=A0ABT8DNV4_9BURK|nr:hemerythrin domain-containing protein [Pelomonas sp. PFR6]MDN3918720.1 hemerythrin domain-containing protein [Pelomonas sp. PFR6]
MPINKALPGFESPAAGFEAPFEMLAACHERLRRSLRLLARLQQHLGAQPQGVDEQARQAAADLLRYFTLAAPAHHEDEERHIVPVLRRSADAALRAAAEQLLREHEQIRAAWELLAPQLREIEAGRLPPRLAEAAEHFGRLHDAHLRLEDELAFPQARVLHEEAGGAAALAAIGAEMAGRRGATIRKTPG